jgi:PHD/YefM family antitoxin component YafN of YafNO toxin-antitoxin module
MNTATVTDIQYISDANGKAVGVIVPISLWREIESEKETAYLLKSERMKTRITEAMKRTDGLSLQNVCNQVGLQF